METAPKDSRSQKSPMQQHPASFIRHCALPTLNPTHWFCDLGQVLSPVWPSACSLEKMDDVSGNFPNSGWLGSIFGQCLCILDQSLGLTHSILLGLHRVRALFILVSELIPDIADTDCHRPWAGASAALYFLSFLPSPQGLVGTTLKHKLKASEGNFPRQSPGFPGSPSCSLPRDHLTP